MDAAVVGDENEKGGMKVSKKDGKGEKGDLKIKVEEKKASGGRKEVKGLLRDARARAKEEGIYDEEDGAGKVSDATECEDEVDESGSKGKEDKQPVAVTPNTKIPKGKTVMEGRRLQLASDWQRTSMASILSEI